ncbi:MAG: cell division topological specificity factor MinE [Aquificae bacterium]|jgi:cell division topological specificity factor|nr:cell division topological specificity factor MinE [Aquificota bacterium]
MGILDFLFGKRSSSAKEAKKRLMMVLEYERKKLPPNFAELLKKDLIEVFSKYPQFDVSNIEVEIKKNPQHNTEELWIAIPFKEN